jgi:hypothetical protein
VKEVALAGVTAGVAFQTAAAVDCSPETVPEIEAPVMSTLSVRASGALLIATSTRRLPCVSSRKALTSNSGSGLVASMRLAPRRMKRA